MKHSLSEIQDLLDSGQLDPTAHEDHALFVALEALPDLLEVARRAFHEPSDADTAAAWARAWFEP